MRIPFLTRKPGTPYTGPSSWCHDPAQVKMPGYYAMTADGSRLKRPLVRLTMVDDAPGVADDGSCHLEIAGKNMPPQMGRIVSLEAQTQGTGSVEFDR